MRHAVRFGILTLGLYLATVGATYAAVLVFMKTASVPNTFSPQQGLAAGLLGMLTALLLMRAAAARVGYRTSDAFLLFVPLANVYIVGKVLWRIAALPDRYWD